MKENARETVLTTRFDSFCQYNNQYNSEYNSQLRRQYKNQY